MFYYSHQMKYCLLIFTFIFFSNTCFAVSNNDEQTQITMTTTQAMQLAGTLVDRGDLEHATQILTKTPQMNNLALEIERWFLLAQIAQKQGDFDSAIKIYRKILDDQPDLARIRFELATCYMHKKQWSRADYHLRLAMAGDDLPENARKMMNYHRYIIRRNKNWNVWFNIGAAPDNNINNATGGTDCIIYFGSLLCNDLTEPVSAIGTNLTLGGNYEFKLSDQWRWKSDANLYSNIYDKHEFDDLYLGASTGPRFVWNRGDIWLAGTIARRWYGWDEYNWSAGVRLDTNYDFTRRLSGGLYLRATENKYDMYGDFLDGQTYAANIRLTYSFNASVYVNMRSGITREDAANPTYSYWQPSISIGIGAELPWGFHAYAEPQIYWTLYDGKRLTTANNALTEITEHDFTHRYALSISNNKFDIWGFVPTLTFSYTQRDSNIWQREFNKTAVEFTMQQRF